MIKKHRKIWQIFQSWNQLHTLHDTESNEYNIDVRAENTTRVWRTKGEILFDTFDVSHVLDKEIHVWYLKYNWFVLNYRNISLLYCISWEKYMLFSLNFAWNEHYIVLIKLKLLQQKRKKNPYNFKIKSEMCMVYCIEPSFNRVTSHIGCT